MDLQNLIIDLRRKVAALENNQTVFIGPQEPRQPNTQTVWINANGTTKFFDGSNWVISGGMLTDWNMTVVFTASDYRTIAWTTGVVSIGTAENKTDYATTSGNFTMTTTTYFYWQADLPTTIQTTTTAGNVVSSGGILLAVGRMNPDTANKAALKVFGGPSVDQIIADEIVANSISTNMLQANAVTASKIATTLLYAGAITLDASGVIKSGQTAYDTGTGFFLGNDAGTTKFSLGNSAGSKVTWDGTTLSITGVVTATSGTIGGFSIGADYIRDTANSFGLASTVTGGDDVRFWAGDTFANRASAPFRITESGAFVATSATINGVGWGSTSVFGNASDGDVTIGVGTTTLTRDMFYNNLIVNGTLDPAGYRIYVKGTLSGTGTISRNGNNGAAGNIGYNSAGGAGGAALNQGSLNADLGGANGGVSTNTGSGVAGTSTNPSYTNISGASGGNPDSGAGVGGAGGTATRGSLYNVFLTVEQAISYIANPASYLVTTQYKGPASSGGGAGNGTPNVGYSGGGAGGNGGVIWIAAHIINFAGGTMSSTGGNGGAGGNSSGFASGGGGGGQGGVIYLISNTFTNIGTQVVTGGTGGAAGGGAPSTAGGNGNDGVTIQITI